MPAPAYAPPMTDLTFDHLYPYAELTDALHGLAAAYPDLLEIESAGQSHEGREIWLVTITNRATGPHNEKPALFVEANIHATEITGSTAALHLIHHLVTGYGNDPAVTQALDTRVAYVIARLNPDGVEMALANPPTYLRSSTRIYPRPDQQPGLIESDIDGDGRVLTMRLPDPNGSWKIHPDEPRLMVPRAIDELGPGPYYRLLPEGTIHEYDGVLVPIAPEHRSLDLNRNFPQEWLPEGDQYGSGPFPTSEPEVRALVEAVVARPEHLRVHRVPHVQCGDPPAVRWPRRRTLPHCGPARLPGARQARDRDHGIRSGVGVPRLQVRPEVVDHRRERRVGLRPPRACSAGPPSSGAPSTRPASRTTSTSTGSTATPSRTTCASWPGTTTCSAARDSSTGTRSTTPSSAGSRSAAGTSSAPGPTRRPRSWRRRSRRTAPGRSRTCSRHLASRCGRSARSRSAKTCGAFGSWSRTPAGCRPT